MKGEPKKRAFWNLIYGVLEIRTNIFVALRNYITFDLLLTIQITSKFSHQINLKIFGVKITINHGLIQLYLRLDDAYTCVLIIIAMKEIHRDTKSVIYPKDKQSKW